MQFRMPYLTRAIFSSVVLAAGFGCDMPNETQGKYYTEPHRPQFHFSPVTGWMNDPNGLVYHEGEYHLFYQHYPDSTVWGPMHWGHAVSTDLMHWEHLPIALYPDSLGYIFSGSAVVDKDNTSGFGKDGIVPLVAIFTHHDPAKAKAGLTDVETQSIAYSLDKGRTWTKYAGNPVVKNPGIRNFRDPKVFWHDESNHWIMPIAAHDHLEFYRSPNLKDWERTGAFGHGNGAHGGVWECPDIFPLTTSEGVQKWVLIQNMDRGAVNGGSGTQYFIGHFDSRTFVNDSPPETMLWLDYGADNYAGVTWFNAPDDRRIFIGWMSQWFDYAQTVPTHLWRSAMTLPRELTLRSTAKSTLLFQNPVPELHALRKDTLVLTEQHVSDRYRIREDQGTCHELQLTFDLSRTTSVLLGFILSNMVGEEVHVGYNRVDSTIFIDRTNAGKSDFSERFARRDKPPYAPSGLLHMQAFIDVASVELFIDSGRVVLTEIFFPNEDFNRTDVFVSGGETVLTGGRVHGLNPIWK